MNAQNQATTGNKLLIAAGLFLGLGLGVFVDGILLHQILQWHHMISNVEPLTDITSIDLNMLWDGLFHALDWILTVIGVILLWQAGRRGDTTWLSQMSGAILMGAGLFNVVEGWKLVSIFLTNAHKYGHLIKISPIMFVVTDFPVRYLYAIAILNQS